MWPWASEGLPYIFFVGQNALDKKHLLLEVGASDQPVLIASHVKDEGSGGTRVVRRRKRPLDRRKVRPVRLARNLQESLKRLARSGMFPGKLGHHGFAIDPQD